MGRIHYLDNLRSFCMLFGIFVHAATVADFGIWEIVPVVSDYFRMATFFAISGFFAALLLSKFRMSEFIGRRARALLVPLGMGLLILNPPTIWLVLRIHRPNLAPSEIWPILWAGLENNIGVVWHLHLWFLVSLFVYVLLAPFANRLIRERAAALETCFRGIPEVLTGLAIGAILAVAVIGARGINIIVNPGQHWLVQATLQYLPYFLLGLAGFHLPGLWNRLHRVDWPLMALAATGLILEAWFLKGLYGYGPEIVRVGIKAIVSAAALFFLLWASRRWFDFTTPMTGRLSTGVYTIYLFHYLVIYVWASALLPAGLSGTALYLAIVALTFITCLPLSDLVARSAVLQFLFNGRVPVRSVRRATVLKMEGGGS